MSVSELDTVLAECKERVAKCRRDCVEFVRFARARIDVELALRDQKTPTRECEHLAVISAHALRAYYEAIKPTNAAVSGAFGALDRAREAVQKALSPWALGMYEIIEAKEQKSVCVDRNVYTPRGTAESLMESAVANHAAEYGLLAHLREAAGVQYPSRSWAMELALLTYIACVTRINMRRELNYALPSTR